MKKIFKLTKSTTCLRILQLCTWLVLVTCFRVCQVLVQDVQMIEKFWQFGARMFQNISQTDHSKLCTFQSNTYVKGHIFSNLTDYLALRYP